MGRGFVTALLGVGTLEPASDWEEAGRLVAFHGLEGLAVARVREAGLVAPKALSDAWEAPYRIQGLRSTLLLESAARARSALRGVGVESLLFKGAALVADGTWADPGARRMDDVDLLVRGADAGRAAEALAAAGFRPVSPWRAERVAWAESLAFRDGEAPPGTDLALDLHWRTQYDRLRFGGEGESPLWEGADALVGVPGPEAHLTVVAEHLLKHLRFKIHLAAFGDLARLVGRVRDWDRVGALASRSRLEAGILAVLAVLAAELAAPVPPAWAARGPARLAARLSPRALLGRVRPVEGRLRGIADRWRMLGAPSRVAADLADAAFPPGAWLRARYGRAGPWGWVRYVGDVVRWSAYRGRSPASPHQELFDARGRE